VGFEALAVLEKTAPRVAVKSTIRRGNPKTGGIAPPPDFVPYSGFVGSLVRWFVGSLVGAALVGWVVLRGVIRIELACCTAGRLGLLCGSRPAL
jgi:hypothetical protein